MRYLSVENFQLLKKILQINDNDKSKMLYHIMEFLSKQGKSLIESNKLTIHFFKKETSEEDHTSPLEQLDLPDEIKRSFLIPITDQRNNPDYFIKNDTGDYMQKIYTQTNDYYQNFEMPDGVDQSALIIDKSDELKRLERDLFNYYQREYTVVLDSRDRNHDDHPSSSVYRLNLNNNIERVHTIQVISAEIPKSGYIINDTNNTIYFQESVGVILEASIVNGNYTINEIISSLQTNMNAVGNSGYSIVITSENRIKITSDLTGGDNIFTLKLNGGTEKTPNGTMKTVYYKNNIGSILGYLRNDLSGTSNYTASRLYDVGGIKNIFMSLTNLPYRRYYTNDGFVKIDMNCDNSDICYYKDTGFIHEFRPTLPRVHHLDFRFTDYQDVIYDFNGQNHSITLKFICYIS